MAYFPKVGSADEDGLDGCVVQMAAESGSSSVDSISLRRSGRESTYVYKSCKLFNDDVLAFTERNTYLHLECHHCHQDQSEYQLLECNLTCKNVL